MSHETHVKHIELITEDPYFGKISDRQMAQILEIANDPVIQEAADKYCIFAKEYRRQWNDPIRRKEPSITRGIGILHSLYDTIQNIYPFATKKDGGRNTKILALSVKTIERVTNSE